MRKIYYFRSCSRSFARTKLLDMASPPTSVEDAALCKGSLIAVVSRCNINPCSKSDYPNTEKEFE